MMNIYDLHFSYYVPSIVKFRGLDFRPDYRKISTLQSWLSAPTIVLTATATEKIQSDVFEVLGLSEETEVVAALPDR